MIINEAFKAKEGIVRGLAIETKNTASTNNVKSKVLEIEKKLLGDSKNETKITKFMINMGKKDEKWPPPKPKGNGGTQRG